MKVNRQKFIQLLVLVLLFLSACSSPISKATDISTQTSEPVAPIGSWADLLQITPVPYASPLPETDATPLDGLYAKFDPNPPQWWACLRCADYRPSGGAWRLQFDRGVMRIYYEVTAWRSVASYQVLEDRLFIFNDPYCKEATGEYSWRIAGGNLILDAVNDPCSLGLRGENLSEYAWQICITGDDEPRGCTDPVPVPVSQQVLPDGLAVTVRKADVRLDTETPDEIINANGADLSLPDGVRFAYGDDSMPYGVNRVLWKENDWMEMAFSGPYTSVGVQFRGSYVIGWARVLFDGQEIWRGDTAEIWAREKIHGGYIEVTGYGPGEHILRVERLDIDSRPVMVAFFGLGR